MYGLTFRHPSGGWSLIIQNLTRNSFTTKDCSKDQDCTSKPAELTTGLVFNVQPSEIILTIWSGMRDHSMIFKARKETSFPTKKLHILQMVVNVSSQLLLRTYKNLRCLSIATFITKWVILTQPVQRAQKVKDLTPSDIFKFSWFYLCVCQYFFITTRTSKLARCLKFTVE